ncbi:MAG TPA: YdeI/OmpD-associated family protein [Streptosporangiaceae bacterium]
MKFRAELQLDGKTATGITVPPEVLETLGGGRRPAVAVTLNGHTYRTTVGVMGGVAKVPVSAAVRDAAGVSAGDVLDVEIVADTTPRTAEVPADLAAAMAANTEAKEFFGQLSYSRQNAWVTWVEQAKQVETRARRVEQTVAMLAEHRPQR